MNKVIIKEIGYDFSKDNIEDFKRIHPLERLEKIYILANYSQLKNMREALAESTKGLNTKNIMSFDDLIQTYKDLEKTYISREEGAWIIKKLMEAKEDGAYSSSLGSAKEILAYFLEIKSFGISPKSYRENAGSDEDLIFLSDLYRAYEDFLRENKLEDDIGLYFDGIKNLENDKRFTGFELVINGFIEFREHELSLLKTLIEKDNKISIQYPFYTKRPNKKVEKTKDSLRNLGFEIIEAYEDLSLENLGLDFFSKERKTFQIKTTVLPAATKLEEVNQVLAFVKEGLRDKNPEDFTIIIPDDYENLLKIKSKEYELSLNIMNEEKARSLPLIKSILNLLYFIRDDEKKKLLSCLSDDNLNFKDLYGPEVDNLKLIKDLRDLDYRGLYYDYYYLDPDLEKFFQGLREEVSTFKMDPIAYLKEEFSKDQERSQALKNFEINQDEKILSDYIKALDILEKVLDQVQKFASIINISKADILEILIEALEEEKYYWPIKNRGIQVLKAINSIGISSQVKIICGMDYKNPSLKPKGYLYSKKFKDFHKALDFSYEDIYEEYDNEILLHSQALAFSKDLVFSYVYPEPEAKDSRSVFLNDSIRRIDETYLLDYGKDGLEAKKDFSSLRDFNYLSKDQVAYINRLGGAYQKRKNLDPRLNGFVEDIKNPKYYYHRAEYSPKMLEYYNQCPFKYYMAYILRYESLDLDYRDTFFLDKGNIYHKVLEEYFKAKDYMILTDEEIEKRIYSILDQINRSEDIKVQILDYQREIYKNYLFAYIKADLIKEKSLGGKFAPAYFEKNIAGSHKNLRLFGRVDRIDQGEDGSFILYDYKTKNTTSKVAFNDLKNIQLSLYGLMIGKERLAGISYGAIEKAEIHDFLYKNDSNEEEINNYFSDLEAIIENIDEKIQSGHFILDPRDNNVCRTCPYGLICRKEDLDVNEI